MVSEGICVCVDSQVLPKVCADWISNSFHFNTKLKKQTDKQTKDGYYSYIILYGNWSDVQF